LSRFRRNCAPQRLPHHPPVHAQLPCHSGNRPCPKLVLPPYLLEQLHLVPPAQPATLPSCHPRSVSRLPRWAKLNCRGWARLRLSVTFGDTSRRQELGLIKKQV